MSQAEAVKKPLTALDELRLLGKFFEDLKAIDAELPFDLLPSELVASKESVTVTLFELPKLSQLVQGEEFIWSVFTESVDFDNLTTDTLYRMRCVAATLLLMFRHDPAWNVSKTLKLGAVQLVELYQFFLGERTGWAIAAVPDAEPEAEVEAVPEKKTRSSSGRKPSGDSATSSPTTDALVTEPLAVAG